MTNGEIIPGEGSPREPRQIPAGVLQFVQTLKDLEGVNQIILHGSSVSDRWRPDSDWDLGVICADITAEDIDEHLRGAGVSVEQVGELNVDVFVFTQDEIDLFEREGRAIGHPMRRIMISNMLFKGRPL